MTAEHAATDQVLDEAISTLRARDPQVDAAAPDPTVTAALGDQNLRLGQRVERVFHEYADRPALGSRTAELVTDPATGRTTRELRDGFTTVTYREVWDRVTALSTDLRSPDAWPADESGLAPGDAVGILGFTSVDYATVDLGCVHAGTVSVPLQASATTAQLTPILDEAGARVLATSRELLDVAVDCVLACPGIRRVIVFDHHDQVDDDREALRAATDRLREQGSDVVIEALDEVVARGAARPAAPLVVPDEADPLMLLIYTSGSTGTPKGAMYPEHLVATLWQGQWMRSDELPRIAFHYMPMSHLAGRVSLIGALSSGGTGYYTAHSDLSALFTDLAQAAPTDIMLVPRVCDMLRQRYDAELDRRAPENGPDEALREEVRAELRRDVLGGRLLRAHVGTAPISEEMHEFLETLLGITVHDGYGSTEDGVVLIDHEVQSPPVLDWTLVDVPDLGYTTADTPHPRGELLVRTETAIPGYFRRPETTAEVFDDDGYYHTGDIMADVGDGKLIYVDRRKNVLKLSQGEFVAVSRLESLFVTADDVRQIFVYGSSERSYLLAVVVPTDEALSGVDDPADLRGSLLSSLQAVAESHGLNSYEIPREIVVETEPFTTENGLLSDARKPLRPRLTEHYGEQLEQLYRDLAGAQNDALRDLRRHGAERPVPETVQQAARTILETTEVPPLDVRFVDLGGDSLSALSFSQLLTEIFAVEVPVGEIVSAASDLASVAAAIEARLAGTGRPGAATVHGADAASVRAGDLRLDAFLDAETLDRAGDLPRATGTPHTVLLTGANGYLGRFLALDWLERLALTGGTLVCVVRGRDDEAARERLDEVIDSGGDAELSARYRRLAVDHLEVRAGDMGEAGLGLDTETWARLASDVDLIVHPAALVNHVLPYDQLFGPNVLGTAELIRLALTDRITPITYLSTVAVVNAEVSDPSEDTDIRVTSPERSLNESYANGYATSKWAGEVLLREAHDAVGLPVSVFRSDLIMAHSTYAGQLNVPDVFTRLLLSVAATGLAPQTFYARPDGWPVDDAGRPRGHYDGLPADFTAEAVTAIGVQDTDPDTDPGFRTFHVLNPHDDGVSLDVIVDWVADAMSSDGGRAIARVDDHTEWVSRFTAAMQALPDGQRTASVLPLMQAFAEPETPVAGPMAPADEFRAAVQDAGVGPDKDIPHLTASLIGKYVTDLRRLGLL